MGTGIGVNAKAWQGGFRRAIGDTSLGATLALALDDTTKQLHICEIADVLTDWARSASSHPEVNIHSSTNPATEYLRVYHDATDAFIDGVGAARIKFAIAGEEILILTSVATAVNEITVLNAATGGSPKLSATGETNVGLIFDTKGTGYMTFSLGGVETLQMHDVAAMVFAAAAATAGHASYLQTEDGGTASAAGAAGGLLHVLTGDGSAGAAGANNGAAGGAFTLQSGAGGAGGNNTATGGAGGALAITAGAGGAVATGGTSTGGAGGDIVLTPGAGGAGDTAGAAGSVKFGTYTAAVATDSTGYILIKDAGGTARKLMVQA